MGFVEIISSPHEGVIHLASTDNLTKTTNTHEHIAEYNLTKRNPTKRQYAMNTCKKILR